jgi:hypothetical protein
MEYFKINYRESIIKILKRLRLTGCHLNHLTTQNTIVGYQKNGSLTAKMRTVASVLFQAKAYGEIQKTTKVIGAQS